MPSIPRIETHKCGLADLWEFFLNIFTGEEVSWSGCRGYRGDRQDQVWGWGSRTLEVWGPVTEGQTREWAPSCRPRQSQKGTPKEL